MCFMIEHVFRGCVLSQNTWAVPVAELLIYVNVCFINTFVSNLLFNKTRTLNATGPLIIFIILLSDTCTFEWCYT